MKKFVVLFVAFAFLASFALIGCNQSQAPPPKKAAEKAPAAKPAPAPAAAPAAKPAPAPAPAPTPAPAPEKK